MCQCTCQKETPQEEGRRLFVEGVGLSNLWGDCSAANFDRFKDVLESFDASYSDPELLKARAASVEANGDVERIYTR